MLKKVKVRLLSIVSRINLPTVIKTAMLPGEAIESLMIATQIGMIYYVRNGTIGVFLDIRSRIIELGASSGGYDERGLLGLAFHPGFYNNGLFYLHYSVTGSQGPGAIVSPGASDTEGPPEPYHPDPCDLSSLNLTWANRDTQFDHIDTVEEWSFHPNEQPRRLRTLLNIRRPFLNHNGVNSLNFSPETGNLVLTTGDGGLGYDPFNLSQNNMEIAGKIIEIDVSRNTRFDNFSIVTRFDELPVPAQEMLTIISKGVRNITGISYQSNYNQYIKYVGNVGQDMVESIYSFIDYQPIPVTKLIEASSMNYDLDQEGFINFGWRGWEGVFPTAIIRSCPDDENLKEEMIAFYDDAVKTSIHRIQPLTCYYHIEPRPDKTGGTALTGVQAYNGNTIPALTGSVVFTDFAQNEGSPPPVRGFLAYTKANSDCKLNDYSVIEIDYDFGSNSAYYTCLGSNSDQTKLYLGVYGSMNVTDYNQGMIFEIIP